MNWLESDRPVDQEILLASYYAAEIFQFEPRQSTYEDLKSTGNIRLFEDIDFRSSLARYYIKAAATAPYIKVSEDFRKMTRGTIPNDIQYRIGSRCPSTYPGDEVPTDFPPCTLQDDIDYDQLSALYEPLKQDEQFKRLLVYRISELRTKNYLLDTLSIYADKVLENIEDQKVIGSE